MRNFVDWMEIFKSNYDRKEKNGLRCLESQIWKNRNL